MLQGLWMQSGRSASMEHLSAQAAGLIDGVASSGEGEEGSGLGFERFGMSMSPQAQAESSSAGRGVGSGSGGGGGSLRASGDSTEDLQRRVASAIASAETAMATIASPRVAAAAASAAAAAGLDGGSAAFSLAATAGSSLASPTTSAGSPALPSGGGEDGSGSESAGGAATPPTTPRGQVIETDAAQAEAEGEAAAAAEAQSPEVEARMLDDAVPDDDDEEEAAAGGVVIGGVVSPVAAEPELSPDELEWLAAWVDEQAEPSEITHEQAAAALSRHRDGRAGAATMARLKEAQLLLAKARAAELRFERAMRDLERARAALPSEAQPSEATSRTPAGFQHSPPSICSSARSLLLAALTQPSPAL